MEKENENTKITDNDLSFIESVFLEANRPLTIQELAKKIAYKKNASQLNQEVKKYDPACKYEVIDLIYKEYNEPLLTSSKCAEPFEGGVVLNVTKKITYENFNCDMLEVDYTGGGVFRKHIDYMKKTKTQILLPSNVDGKNLKPKVLEKEEDPRFSELPMTDKDLKKLEKNLEISLSKSEKFFGWNDHWQLKEKQVAIPEDKIKKIEEHFLKTKHSIATTDLVTQFFGPELASEAFELHGLSLNYIFEKKYKKKFIFVCPLNWGKWILKKTLDSFLENLPLSAPQAKLPALSNEKKPEVPKTPDFPLKIYLTWREILSGGFKIPRSLSKEFSCSREYIFTDTDGEKDYIVYYYPSQQIFLGLKEFYEANNAPQGTSLTIERKNLTHFHFTLKKSKKKLLVPQVVYDPKEDQFSASKQEAFTYSLPNKIIYLDKETLDKVISLYGQRNDADLRDLLILIFKNFGLRGEAISLHSLRAYHLVDMLRQTSQEDVEKTLLLSKEFTKSEKKKGLSFYKERVKTEEEIIPEETTETAPEISAKAKVEEALGEILPEIGTVGEISVPEGLVEIEKRKETKKEVRVEVPSFQPKEEIEERPKKEKPSKPTKEKEIWKKKQKIKMEGEVEPRRRKGERKIIEEQIELEESELEALLAIKAREKKEAEEVEAAKTREKKEEYKPFVTQEPKFGLFADKLKSALDKPKKKEEKKPKK